MFLHSAFLVFTLFPPYLAPWNVTKYAIDMLIGEYVKICGLALNIPRWRRR